LLPATRTVAVPDGAKPQDVRVYLTFELRNVGDQAVKVLPWYTPLEEISGDIFDCVGPDGSKAKYQGEQTDRGPPDPKHFLTIKPGQTLARSFRLPYDLSGPGTYTVSLKPSRPGWLQSIVEFYYGGDKDKAKQNPDKVFGQPLGSNTVTVRIIGAVKESPSEAEPARPARAIRLKPDAKRSVAYLTGHYAEVYLVVDDTVVQLLAPLPAAERRGPVEFDPANDKSKAWLFEGKEVSKYVLPQGPSRIPPVLPAEPGEPAPKPLYTEQKASSGTFTLTNLPARMSFQYGGSTEVRVKRLSFASGTIEKVTPLKLDFQALPP
jgi:hypothetical protein